MFHGENVVKVEATDNRRTCAVCGGVCFFKYYNAFTCEACKQFFRRTILTEKILVCSNGGNCDLSADFLKCRACRLNKCLSVGMEPQMVKTTGVVISQEYLDKLEKHKKSLMCQQNGHKPVISRTDQNHQHSQSEEANYEKLQCSLSLVPAAEGRRVQNAGSNTMTMTSNNSSAMNRRQAIDAENCQFEGQIVGPEEFGLANWPLEKRSLIGSCKTAETLVTVREMVLNHAKYEAFYANERVFREDFVTRFGTLHELFESHISILSDVDKYTVPICDSNGQTSYRTILCMDLFSLLDVFRSVMAFSLLSLDDQVRLFTYMGSTVGSSCVKYRSMMANSEIELKLPSNIVPLREMQRFAGFSGDLMAQKMALHLFFNLMEPFCKSRLSLEEFLLLRAILICHSSTPNLSRHAQKLLQNESERYAGILLHFLQLKHGNVAGASRYAEVMQVVVCLLHSKGKHHSYLKHLSSGILCNSLHKYTPSLFVPMMLDG
ncbi:hypothetical protein niasHT_038157 [Heterodera trifolii]|uniref:Uncharacterized protein n=1 Tax=Heterodera trifolii TaxID=157864 RepID=A0ABD2I2F5_9BILA